MNQNNIYLSVLIGLLILSIFVLMFSNRRCKDTDEQYRSNKDKKVHIMDDGNINNIDTHHWEKLVRYIAQNYYEHDAFLIVSNIDGLTYLASALAFMLENLDKPIALTTKKDVKYAIKILQKYKIPEVVICVNNKVLRGCCTTVFTEQLMSLHHKPLCIKGKLYPDNVLDNPTEPFKPLLIDSRKKVVVVKLYPGISGEQLQSIGKVYGLVLESYGKGHIPLSQDFIENLRSLVDQGVVVVQTSMDRLSITDTSLEQIGVVCGGKQTTETVFAKLSLIFSNVKSAKPELVKKLMTISMRGEL